MIFVWWRGSDGISDCVSSGDVTNYHHRISLTCVCEGTGAETWTASVVVGCLEFHSSPDSTQDSTGAAMTYLAGDKRIRGSGRL